MNHKNHLLGKLNLLDSNPRKVSGKAHGKTCHDLRNRTIGGNR